MGKDQGTLDRQFNGVIYSSFSEVPEDLITKGYAAEKYIDHVFAKCRICAESFIQDECMSKLSVIVNMLSHKEKTNVLDFGGGVGQIYFGIEKYLTTPRSVQWNVIDVERIIQTAKERVTDKQNLSFYTSIDEIEKIDVLFFRQSLQVVENYKEMIAGIVKKYSPKVIFISGATSGENEDYISLLLLEGDKGVPCYFFNEKNLVSFVEGQGYFLVDKFFENICLNLSNYPESKHQLDSKRENYVRSYVFVR